MIFLDGSDVLLKRAPHVHTFLGHPHSLVVIYGQILMHWLNLLGFPPLLPIVLERSWWFWQMVSHCGAWFDYFILVLEDIPPSMHTILGHTFYGISWKNWLVHWRKCSTYHSYFWYVVGFSRWLSTNLLMRFNYLTHSPRSFHSCGHWFDESWLFAHASMHLAHYLRSSHPWRLL